jgi:hypothetical protein
MNENDEITIEKLREYCEYSRTGAEMTDDIYAMMAFDFALAWIDNDMYNKKILYQKSYLDKNGEGFSDTEPWIVDYEFEAIEPAELKRDFMIEEGYKDVKINRMYTDFKRRMKIELL